MPSKIQLDENLWFLFTCLQKSDYKNIDFNAVGDATNLKPPAARMRYTRLRRQIENGTLIGTHGTPFQRGADKAVETPRKRKRLFENRDDEEMLTEGVKQKVKIESGDQSDDYETDTSYESNSEDEIPLAKRKSYQRHRPNVSSRGSLGQPEEAIPFLGQDQKHSTGIKFRSQEPMGPGDRLLSINQVNEDNLRAPELKEIGSSLDRDQHRALAG